MFKLILLLFTISNGTIAFADAPKSCPQSMSGKIFCVSGEKMLCNREFDSTTNEFRFEWHAVNEDGQTFDVFSPYYRKVPGYTPAKCSNPDVGHITKF